MSAANIHRYFGSKRMCEIQGALGLLPFSASLFLVGFLAITGSPPFGTFLSEFAILRGIFAADHLGIGIFFLLFLAIIFIGMGSTVIPVALGPSMDEDIEPSEYRETLLTIISPLLLMVLVFFLGVYVPEPLGNLFTHAARIVEVAP